MTMGFKELGGLFLKMEQKKLVDLNKNLNSLKSSFYKKTKVSI
jgi:hypothetical protein